MSNQQRVTEAQLQAAADRGAYQFTVKKGDEFNPCQANVNLLLGAIITEKLGRLDAVESWEKAYELLKTKLAPPVKEEPIPEPEESPYPYDFDSIHPAVQKLDLKNARDLSRLDPAVYKAFWFDAQAGKPTQNQKDFRLVVQAILDKSNSERGRR